jgi:hypothetical protein
MRLLECLVDGNIGLTEDLTGDTIPPYAILSHTWGSDADEVTYRDLIDGTGGDKPGYKKIQFCTKQARHDDLGYVWVDTCCIDKSDSVELQKSINSMFRWYQNATRCYVYLSGITGAGYTEDQLSVLIWESAFQKHRWFTRGWTLQEPLAP